jgi:hypothetical protein
MSLNATTLSGAINATQYSFGIASATGVSAPVYPTGSGFTYLYVENELMFVTGVNGTIVNVIRGFGGTQAVSHASSCPVIVGAPSDFPNFTPGINAVTAKSSNYDGFAAPVASAATITPSGRRFHVTGTTQTTTINLPSGFLEGTITIVADGIWTWSTGGNIAVAGTVTTAASAVDFTYDAKTSLWYPSRLA